MSSSSSSSSASDDERSEAGSNSSKPLPKTAKLPGTEDVATDVRFAGSRLAVATLAGTLEMFNFEEAAEDEAGIGDDEEDEENLDSEAAKWGQTVAPISSIAAHSNSIRSLDVLLGKPDRAFSVSRDRSIAISDLNTGKVVGRVAHAHAAHGNAITCLGDGNFFSTGDEDGEVCIWDARMVPLDPLGKAKGKPDEAERKKKGMVQKYSAGNDYISDMLWHDNKKRLLVTSGDGFLSVVDPRSPKQPIISLQQPADLLSLSLLRNGSKILAGCQDGTVTIWSWNEWDDPTDRFVGHPDSIECIVPLSEDEFVTGSGDGIVRRCGAFPNRLVGVVGAVEDGMPVEKLRLGYPWGEDGPRVLASATGHDRVVMFWDPDAMGDLAAAQSGEQDDDDDDDDEEQGDEDEGGGSEEDSGEEEEEDSSAEEKEEEKQQVPTKRKKPTGSWKVEDLSAADSEPKKKGTTAAAAQPESKKPKKEAKPVSDSDEDSEDSEDDSDGNDRRKNRKQRAPDGKKSFTSQKGKAPKGASFYSDL